MMYWIDCCFFDHFGAGEFDSKVQSLNIHNAFIDSYSTHKFCTLHCE